MFQQDPQQRLWLINQRNEELVHAAEQELRARAHSTSLPATPGLGYSPASEQALGGHSPASVVLCPLLKLLVQSRCCRALC